MGKEEVLVSQDYLSESLFLNEPHSFSMGLPLFSFIYWPFSNKSKEAWRVIPNPYVLGTVNTEILSEVKWRRRAEREIDRKES